MWIQLRDRPAKPKPPIKPAAAASLFTNLHSSLIAGIGDHTVFIESEPFLTAMGVSAADSNRHSFDFSEGFRVHAASAFEGKYFSVTVRTETGTLSDNRPATLSLKTLEEQNGAFGLELKLDSGGPKSPYFVSRSDIAREAIQGIFADKGANKATGLVLVTGETGSGKSQFLNCLLSERIARSVTDEPRGRRPHVVVVGDPIETKFFSYSGGENLNQIAEDQNRLYASRLVDYTPRVLGKDTPTVRAALTDALRETPRAFVVNELREDEDFFAALDFAGTGHLIFATAHCTSLPDAFGKLSRLVEADTAARRSALVQRLHAVIHMTPLILNSGKKVTLPTIWRNGSTGSRSFIADGLAALVPKGQSQFADGSPVPSGVLGLSWIAERLKAKAPHDKDLPELLKLCRDKDFAPR